jgi:hypothetical protein
VIILAVLKRLELFSRGTREINGVSAGYTLYAIVLIAWRRPAGMFILQHAASIEENSEISLSSAD